MTDAEKREVFCGYRWIRLTEQKYDLKNNPEIWRGVWMANSEMLLAEWIEEHPGTRPVVWWKFSAPEDRDDEEESEVEYLDRHGLLSLEEIEIIRGKARELVEYNRGRHGNDHTTNYIPPHDVEQFAIDHGLLAEEEEEILSRCWDGADSPDESDTPRARALG